MMTPAMLNRPSWMKRRPQPSDRICHQCGIAFAPKRSDAQYCGNPCRQRAYRARSALDVTPVADAAVASRNDDSSSVTGDAQ